MELLKKLTQADSVSGDENAVCEIIENEIKKYCDDITKDAMGNLIAHKKGNGKKVMFAAHMDEIGVVATFIDDKGFVRFSGVGGLYTEELVHRRVRFKNGTVGIIGSETEDFYKNPKLDKLYIDIGASDKEDAGKKVQTGDMAVFTGGFEETDSLVISKVLDNRVGCYVLAEALKKITNNKNDLYFVFTTQEEVGLRGARVAAFSINPDFAIAVDVTDTGDTPDETKMAVKLGAGAAIKVMDRSVLCDTDVRLKMIDTAKKCNIPYQLEIMTDGGTDAGAIHLTRAGIKTGGISIPTRYIHSPSEMANKDDINACIDLAVRIADEF